MIAKFATLFESLRNLMVHHRMSARSRRRMLCVETLEDRVLLSHLTDGGAAGGFQVDLSATIVYPSGLHWDPQQNSGPVNSGGGAATYTYFVNAGAFADHQQASDSHFRWDAS